MARNIVGVDMGSAVIKVVCARPKPKFKILSASLVAMADGVIEDGRLADPDQLGRLLRRAFSEAKVSPFLRKVALSVGAEHVILRAGSVPHHADLDEFTETVEQEVDQHLQLSDDENYLSWYAYDPGPKDTERDVVFAGCRQEVVDERLRLVRSLYALPRVVDCELLAALNCYTEALGDGARQQLVGVVDVGATTTKIAILREGRYRFSALIPFGGRSFDLGIASYLGEAIGHAQQVKIAASLGDSTALQRIADPMRTIAEGFADEVGNVIEGYLAERVVGALVGGSLDGLVLCGASARLPGLLEALAGRIGISVQRFNPFDFLPTSRGFRSSQVARLGEIFAVATGLTLREDVV